MIHTPYTRIVHGYTSKQISNATHARLPLHIDTHSMPGNPATVNNADVKYSLHFYLVHLDVFG
jgi:hypothetical protein